MSHSAEKCKRGDPLGFINIYSVAKYQKTRKGDSFRTLKNFRKKSHNAEKNRKGGPFSLVRFCSLRLKSKKNKRGPFGITWMRFPGIRLVEHAER